MHCYWAYGLKIGSSVPLPDLAKSGGTPDVVIRFKKLNGSLSRSLDENGWLRSKANEVLLSYPKVGNFLVGKSRIVIDPAPDAGRTILRSFALGPALGLLLHLRQRLVLHAGTIAIGGVAVAILGECGSGKSSLCAALYRRGHAFVADDITRVDRGYRKEWVAVPALPQMKLWQDSARSLGYDSSTLSEIHSGSKKRTFRTLERFAASAVPLRRIYVLTRGIRSNAEPIRPMDAVVELIRHAYCARVVSVRERARHFLQCGRLARDVPVFRLKRSSSLAALSELATLIEQDLEQDASN